MTLNVTFRGVKLSVGYTYYPEEAMTSDYPGSDESIEIEEVLTAHGDDIVDLLYDCMNELETACLEAYRDEYKSERSEYERMDRDE